MPVLNPKRNVVTDVNPFNTFWLNVEKTNTCWLWTGCVNHGYPRFQVKGKNISAHRFIFESSNGKIPRAFLIRHSCNDKLCVNPDHLFLGTYKEIMSDLRKNKIHLEKRLSDFEIKEILSLSKLIGPISLSNKFRVSVPMILKVINDFK